MSRRSGLQGVTKVRRLLRRLPNDLVAPVRKELATGAKDILQDAKVRVPKNERVLEQALTAKGSRDGFSWQIGIRGLRAKRKAFYGAFVEFGTQGAPDRNIPAQPARPFLFPAFESQKKPIIAAVRRAINRVLRRAAQI